MYFSWGWTKKKHALHSFFHYKILTIFLSMFLIKLEFVFHYNKGISTKYYCGKGFKCMSD